MVGREGRSSNISLHHGENVNGLDLELTTLSGFGRETAISGNLVR